MSALQTLSPVSVPVTSRRVRAYFAPVNRVGGIPTLFDPALNAAWNGGVPPSPWVDLGWIADFKRVAESKITALESGLPSAPRMQARQTLGATVSWRFVTWSKLAMAIAGSSENMNVLAPALPSGSAIGSGAKAKAAVPLLATSTATTLYVASGGAAPVSAGSLIVVDQDYALQSGFVGAGVSGAYVQSAAAVGSDPDYVRRVSFNVARVGAIGADGGIQLCTPLAAGAPTSTMKVQQIYGFVDREGGSFFQEWSALFVVEGTQGEKVFFHYPRLQPCASAQELSTALAPDMTMMQLGAACRALPVLDGNDAQQVLCYRTYIPGASSSI